MGNNQVRGESLGYFNLARGLGMVSILAGHSLNPLRSVPETAGFFTGAGSILGGGIIAAFFMISGFGFYRRSPRKCLAVQKKLLLRPYYLTAAAVLITKLLLALLKRRSFLQHGGELVFTYLLGLNGEGGGQICGIPIESVSILWFILALFAGWLIYNGCLQLKSKWLRRGIIAGCVIGSYLMTLIAAVWPFCLPMGLLAAGYLAAGDYIRRNGFLEKKLPGWLWGSLILVVLICAAFGDVNIVAGVWGLGLLDVAGSFCAGFLLLRLYARWMQRDRQGRINGLLEEIGLHSIWIVCLHAYEKIIFPWYRVYEMLSGQPWLAAVLCFAGRCAVMYLLYRIIVCLNRYWKRKRHKKKITIEL